MLGRALKILRELAHGREPVVPPAFPPTVADRLSEWENAQGIAASGHNAVYLSCLRETARRIAAQGGPLVAVRLTPEQMAIDKVRAVHQVRLVRFGAVPCRTEAWWEQVEITARGMGLPLGRAEWERHNGGHYRNRP